MTDNSINDDDIYLTAMTMDTAVTGSQTPCCVQLCQEVAKMLVKEIQEAPLCSLLEMASLLAITIIN